MLSKSETTRQPTNRLGFIHIPKTGGTSVREILDRFGEAYLPKAWDYQSFIGMLDGIDIVVGHMPYWYYTLESNPRALFTVLRDPTRRIISFYKYIISSPHHYAHRYVVSNGLTLAACYDHPMLRVEMCNFQTRMLGWLPKHKLRLPCIDEEGQVAFAMTQSAYLFSNIDCNTLETAKNLLQSKTDFSVLERPESILAMIARMTGESCATVPHSNNNESKYEVTSEDIDFIVRNNYLDQELYDTALSILSEKC